MNTTEFERASAIARCLGMPFGVADEADAPSQQSDMVGIGLLIDEARQTALIAAIMDDERQHRIVAKTLRGLERLRAQAHHLTETARELCATVAASGAEPLPTRDELLSDENVDRVEWALAAVTRWIERQLPRSQRRDSSRSFVVEWTEPSGLASWADTAMEPVSFLALIADCMTADAGFTDELAAQFAQEVIRQVRYGETSEFLPRLVRLDEPADKVTVLRLRPRGNRTSPQHTSSDEAGVADLPSSSSKVELPGYNTWDNVEEEAELASLMPPLAVALDEAVCIAGLPRSAERLGASGLQLVRRGIPLDLTALNNVLPDDVALLTRTVAQQCHRSEADVAGWISRTACLRMEATDDMRAIRGYGRVLDGLNQIMAESKK